MSHSVLSASASHRWLNCAGSVRLCQGLPDESSSYAQEGTLCHELCAYKLAQLVGRKVDEPKSEFSQEMIDCAEGYVDYVNEHLTKTSQTFIEQRVDYSEYIGVEGFGTADCIVIDENTLTLIDYKHGMGVPVSATDNTQLQLYALGAYSAFKDIYDINKIVMCIYQPRISNVSSFELDIDELLCRAESYFKPRAALALSGIGEFHCGKWCQFCKAKNLCRARAEANLATARKDFALPPLLSEQEILVILDKLEPMITWANDIKDFVFNEALKGKHWDGWKLVAGRSTRKYKDESAVAQAVEAQGLDPWERKVLGITAMTKLLGKKKFDELLGGLLTKSEGKPTLVPESDKRPAIKSAAADFAQE